MERFGAQTKQNILNAIQRSLSLHDQLKERISLLKSMDKSPTPIISNPTVDHEQYNPPEQYLSSHEMSSITVNF